MNQTQIDKFEADIQQVEKILDHARADLLNLLAEDESPEAPVMKADASDAGENVKKSPGHRSYFGWLTFRPHKS